jgi:hypothetical protein
LAKFIEGRELALAQGGVILILAGEKFYEIYKLKKENFFNPFIIHAASRHDRRMAIKIFINECLRPSQAL